MATTEAPRHGRDAAVSIRRMVNDSIAQLATRLDDEDGELFDFICECGDLRCEATRRMTLTEFWATGPGLVVGH